MMIVGESTSAYVDRAKSLASAVMYRGIEVTEEQNCRRVLTGFPPLCIFVREGLAFNFGCSFPELEHALVNIKALHMRPDGADGHTLDAGFKQMNEGRRCGGCGGRHSDRGPANGARGRHDGRHDGRSRHQW